MKISRRVSGIKISAIKEMPLIASQVEGCVSLGQGVPSFATPPHIVEAVHQALTQEELGRQVFAPTRHGRAAAGRGRVP